MNTGKAAGTDAAAGAEDNLKEDVMKIAVAADKQDKSAKIDPRFGRAQFFAVFDDEKNEYEFASNKQNLSLAQGAGIQAARSVIDTGADILIAKNVGPKAYDLLSSSGVDIFICKSEVSVTDAVDLYKNGKLEKLESANAEGHW